MLDDRTPFSWEDEAEAKTEPSLSSREWLSGSSPTTRTQ